MEVKDALALMFAFGMFILALLAYIKKKQTAPGKVTVYPTFKLPTADCSFSSDCTVEQCSHTAPPSFYSFGIHFIPYH